MSPFYGVGALAYRWRIELQKGIEECQFVGARQWLKPNCEQQPAAHAQQE
jgi:hypothetical protein